MIDVQRNHYDTREWTGCGDGVNPYMHVNGRGGRPTHFGDGNIYGDLEGDGHQYYTEDDELWTPLDAILNPVFESPEACIIYACLEVRAP